MSDAPKTGWVKWWPAETLSVTLAMSPWEEIAYRRLLDFAVMRGDVLPTCDKVLARLTRLPGRWKKVKAGLIAERVLIEDGNTLRIVRPIDPSAHIGRTDLVSPEWRALRITIFERDGYACRYCGTQEGPFECDHVVPVSRGGDNDPDNLATSCKPCNASKGARTLAEWKGVRA